MDSETDCESLLNLIFNKDDSDISLDLLLLNFSFLDTQPLENDNETNYTFDIDIDQISLSDISDICLSDDEEFFTLSD